MFYVIFNSKKEYVWRFNLTVLPNGKFCVLFVVCCCCLCVFFKSTFLKHSSRNTIRVSNTLNPDQDRRYVGPDLGPNCLQRLSADDTRR